MRSDLDNILVVLNIMIYLAILHFRTTQSVLCLVIFQPVVFRMFQGSHIKLIIVSFREASKNTSFMYPLCFTS